MTASAWLRIGPTLASPATSVLTLRNRAIRPVGGASMHHRVVDVRAVLSLRRTASIALPVSSTSRSPGRSWWRSRSRPSCAARCRRDAGCRTSRGTRAAPPRGRWRARRPRRRRARPRPGAPRRAAAGESKSCGDALPALDLDQQHPPAAGRQRERQRRGDGGLAGAALAGDDVQPHARPSRSSRSPRGVARRRRTGTQVVERRRDHASHGAGYGSAPGSSP